MRLFYVGLTLSLLWSASEFPAPSIASAQDAPAAQADARRLFQEGLALAESQRWAEALSSFRRSADLVPRASTSYNIANALYRMGRPADAIAELDAYEAMPGAPYDYRALERSDALRRLLEPTVAELRLAITPAGADVYVDGRRSTVTGFERTLRLNPGTHSLRITQESYASYLRELKLEPGARQAYTIALTPLLEPAPSAIGVTAATTSDTQLPQDDRKPFVKRPGFWVMIGAIVVVGVGVGVTVALVKKDDSPQCGTTGNCASTQGLTVASF